MVKENGPSSLLKGYLFFNRHEESFDNEFEADKCYTGRPQQREL